MAQHTTGPWTVTKSGSFGWSIRANWQGEDAPIAHVDAGICEIKGRFFEENKANGRLIAAAPDLLWLVERATAIRNADNWTMAERERSWAAWDDARAAALAKVEG